MPWATIWPKRSWLQRWVEMGWVYVARHCREEIDIVSADDAHERSRIADLQLVKRSVLEN